MNYKNRFNRNSINQKSNKSVVEILSILTVFTTLFGYAALVSYTLPIGFFPIVSLESLPILLISFTTLVVTLLVYAALIWLPLSLVFPLALRELINLDALVFKESWWLTYKYLNNFYFYFFGFCLIASVMFWYFLASVLGEVAYVAAMFLFSIMLLGAKLNKYNGYVMLLLALSTAVFVYLSLGTISIERVLNLILWSVMTLTALITFLSRKKKNRFFYMTLGSIALIFYVLVSPVILFSDVKKGYVPNVLVQSALQRVHLGGNLPVRILSSNRLNPTEGKLLFYDGHKAWLKECNYHNGKPSLESSYVVTEITVSKITFFKVGYDVCKSQ